MAAPMTTPASSVIAIITGERGQREIVRPLAAVGVRCLVLDWELLCARNRLPYLRFIRAVAHLIKARPGATVFTDMNSAFLAVIVAEGEIVAALAANAELLAVAPEIFPADVLAAK